MRRFALVLLLAAGCAPAVPPLELGPDRPQQALSDADIDAIATVLRLEDHRTFDAAIFDELATSPSVEVRRRAATAAGRIGDPVATGLLTHLLARDASPAVRADAAFALGILGDTTAAVLQALRDAAPRDWTPVRDDETTVVVEVVAALGRLGTDRARSDIVDVLRRVHPGQTRHARRIAAEALLAVWKFPAGAGRAVSAIRFLDHPDPELRWRAALALVRLGEPDGTARLLPALEDDDHRVRALAARALTAPAADSAGVGDAALRALSGALGDPHPHVRINAVRSLATFGDRADADAAAALLQDREPNVAAAAAAALGELGPAAAEHLAAFVGRQDAPRQVRNAALPHLAALDPATAAPVVRDHARGDWAQRYAAARSLGALDWDVAREVLEALVGDDDPRVATAAAEAAAAFAGREELGGASPGQLRNLLLRFAAGEQPRARVPALRALGPLLAADDVPALLDLYARFERRADGRPSAIAVVRALGAVPEAAPAFFDRFDRHADHWVVRAVADTLGIGWGPAPPAAMAEDDEAYRAIVRRYIVPALSRGARPEARIGTPHGEIRVELRGEEAPLTVHNFITLAEAGYYDDGVWHRVVPNFVLQDGAPAGDPSGGPGWTIRDELNRIRYDRGTVGMALAGPDTGGSQWFITHSSQPHLEGGYTVFGTVTAGERVMDRVSQGEAVESIRIRNGREGSGDP